MERKRSILKWEKFKRMTRPSKMRAKWIGRKLNDIFFLSYSNQIKVNLTAY